MLLRRYEGEEKMRSSDRVVGLVLYEDSEDVAYVLSYVIDGQGNDRTLIYVSPSPKANHDRIKQVIAKSLKNTVSDNELNQEAISYKKTQALSFGDMNNIAESLISFYMLIAFVSQINLENLRDHIIKRIPAGDELKGWIENVWDRISVISGVEGKSGSKPRILKTLVSQERKDIEQKVQKVQPQTKGKTTKEKTTKGRRKGEKFRKRQIYYRQQKQKKAEAEAAKALLGEETESEEEEE